MCLSSILGLSDREEGKNFASCITWFACLEPLIVHITANIDKNSSYEYEIFRVNVKTVITKPLPNSNAFKAVNSSE